MSTRDRPPDHSDLLAQQAFLRRLTRRLVADEHGAADLAQESALAALERAPETVVSMRSWLGRVARSLASNTARNERVRHERERQAAERAGPRTPEDVTQQIELQREVLAVLSALEEPYKGTLFMRYWEDLPPNAIAARTGVPVSTVKTRLARGLDRMRARLDARHRGERGAWALALAGSSGSWGRPAVGAVAAAGGIGVGMKVAFTIAVAGALAFGAWWILQAGEEPVQQATRPSAEPLPIASAPGASTHAARTDRRETAPLALETERAAVALGSEPPPAWQLELDLSGFGQNEDGSLAITVRTPALDGRQLEFERGLSGTLSLDVSELFERADQRPEHLAVRLDHPWHLPCDTAVLVPSELREPSATGGRLQRSVRLRRARAVVTGTVVMVEGDTAEKQTWVALYPMQEAGRPAQKPLEEVNPGPGGTFRLRANEALQHVVAAHVRPAAFGQPANVRPESRIVALADGAVTALDPIVLREEEVIEGRVTFPAELEPYGGRVHLELADAPLCSFPDFAWIGGRFELRRAFAEWDDEGRFRIGGLAPRRHELVPFLERKLEVPTVLSLGPDHVHHVVPSASGVQVPIVLSRIAFRVTSAGAPAAHAEFRFRVQAGGAFTWESHPTDELGRIVVALDPSHGLDCEVDDRVHQRKALHFTPAELEGATEIEIPLGGEPVSGTATLAIRLGGRAREAGEGLVVDARFFDRSHAEAMSLLEGAIFHSSGSRPVAQIMQSNRSVPRLVEDDTHVFSELPAGSYVVRLTPRLGDADTTCLLLPSDFSVDLETDERVERDWIPELGGGLRFNMTGGAAWAAWLHDAAGERLRLGYRIGTAHSSAPAIPGVSELSGALPEGMYELRFSMNDGTERAVPVQVYAGRVIDVVIDVDAL